MIVCKTLVRVLALALPLLVAGLGQAADDPKPKPLSEADIVKLLELQLDADAIITRVQKAGVDFKLDDAAVARLKKAGASDRVIAVLQGDRPLATAKHGKKVILEIVEIKRTEDKFLQITWRYRNPTDKNIEALESDSYTRVNISHDSGLYMMEKLYFTYAKGSESYKVEVVRDKDGYPFAIQTAKGLVLPAKETSGNYWAKFAIPPADVKKITLHMVNVDPFVLDLPGDK